MKPFVLTDREWSELKTAQAAEALERKEGESRLVARPLSASALRMMLPRPESPPVKTYSWVGGTWKLEGE